MNKGKLKIIPFLIILVGLGSYFYQTQKTVEEGLRFTGNVEGTEIQLTTEVPGELIKMNTMEGASIKEGIDLFQVDVSDYNVKLKQLELQQDIATLNYENILAGASEDEINVAKSSKQSIVKQLSGATYNYNHLKDVYEDTQILKDSGAVSQSTLDSSKLQMDQAYATMKSLQAQVATADATLEQVLSGADEETLAIAKAEIDLRALEIENLKNTINKGIKYAPISGVVQTVNYEVGEYLSPGMTILSIINMDTLTVDVYVPEKSLFLVNVGDRVKITEGFLEGKEVSGEVVAISSKAEFTPKNTESKESKQEMVFKTTVEIQEGKEYLKPGMFVDVDILPLVE
jgi:HlyD family secretion protein